MRFGRILAWLMCIVLLGVDREGWSQTDFAPGEIMFTGYKSDDADAFSIVLLAPVAATTVIYITDRGWSNTAGYRVDATAEGTISFTFTSAVTCGTEIFFNDVGGTNDWLATDSYGIVLGTVAIQAGGDVDGMELGANGGDSQGDQLSIYQLPEPTSGNQGSFVCMIQMDNNPFGAVDTDEESELPTGLASDDIVRFNTEVDNARYDCTPNTGLPATLQAAITNDNGAGGLKADNANNWIENNNNTVTMTPCFFCCGTTPPANAPTLSAPFVVNTSSSFTITITGTLASGASWQLFTAGCGVGSPLQTTMSNSFTVTASATEGYTTYYVRSSEQVDCAGLCGTVTVHACINANSNYNTCTNCAANETTCGDCLLPYPADNPDLDSGCYALKVIFILDESGSIGSNAQDVENGVLAFLNALNGQDAQVALIEFANLATTVNGYTTVNQPYIDAIDGYFNGVPYNGQTYVPNGSTNWHDAMIKADALTTADLILFFTDGVPTAFTNTNGTVNFCTSGATTETPESVNPVKLANKLKGEGTHMFMLGVGGGVNVGNLQDMSGYTAYANGVNTLATSDYSVGNFATLAQDLQNFIIELCNTTIIMTKEALGPVCDGQLMFRFRIINLGNVSAATGVTMIDTLQSGYTDPFYIGPFTKFCVGAGCSPPQPPNVFHWDPFSVPPLDTVELIVVVTVLPTGNYTNTAWTYADNADTVFDVFNDPLTYDQPPAITCPANITIQCQNSTMPSTTGNPNATDPDGPTPTVSYSDVTASGSCPVIYTITRTFTATDQCGQTANCVQNIVVADLTPPVLTCPANVTVDCLSSTTPASLGTATATDACDPTPSISYTDVTVAGICDLEFVVLRTWKAIDDCNLMSTCVQTINVDDSTPPTMTCAKNVTINCTDSTSPANTGFSSATNNCGGSATIAYVDNFVNTQDPPSCILYRTWTATDNCLNSSTCVQSIVMTDNSPPSLTCPANITIGCLASTAPASTGQATATDNCDTAPEVTYTDVIPPGICPQSFVLSRTWKSTDKCGNMSTCVQTITKQDITPPSLTCPGNVTVQCAALVPSVATGSVTTSDVCDNSPTVTFVSDVTVNQTCTHRYTVNRTYRSTDDCGNSATCVQVITVHDNTAPGLTCPPNITVQCASLVPAVALGSVSASDNCVGTPVITHVSDVTVNQTCINRYTVQRTYRATDDCGNSATCAQVITVFDNTAPTMTCLANVTVQCAASVPPVNTAEISGSDNCGGTPVITHVGDVTVNQTCTNRYTLNRTFRATDACGNSTTCVQVITVFDDIAPTMTCPAGVTVQCASLVPAVSTASVTASDNCTLSPTITHVSDITVNQTCTNQYTLNRTYRATDACGNSTTCVQVIIIFDNTNPGITCPANITVQCASQVPVVNTESVTASDNCTSTPTVTHVSDVTVNQTCTHRYTLQRTYRATDACGNSATCVQVITVFDNTVPTLTCPPNITIACTASSLPAATGSATATDNCNATLSITYTDVTSVPAGCPQEFTITRTWRATDDCGNSSTCVQLIVIDDALPPVISCPASVTIECTASTAPTNTGTATASDNCDTSPNITYADVTPSSPNCPQEYLITRTWTATDTCGNSSTCVQTIFVQDNTPPEITCPANITIECIDITLPVNTGTPTATDNCDPAPEFDYVDFTVSISGTNGFLINRTWTTVDACGNDMTCLQVITVENPLDPEILGSPFDTICSGNMVVFQAVDPGIDPMTYTWSFGTGSSPSSATGIGPHTVTYTYNSTNGSVGAYVILTLTTPGCPPVSDTVSNIHVNAIPNPNISATPAGSVCVLQAKTFQPQAPEMPGYTYLWNFGSGASTPTAMGYGPHSIDYFTSGSKTVQLIVWSNEAGASCGDTATLTFTVNICPGQITGRVFLNTTTSDTTGITNVNVRLYADQNLDGVADNATVIRNVFTNTLGQYSMATVTPGYYIITQIQPTNYFSLWDDDTSEDYDSLSNFNPNDNIIPVTVEPNEIDTRNFFVEVANPSIISGYVFDDFNGSQTPQPIEGIPNVTMTLWTDANANGIPDPGGLVTSTTTNSIGFYTFGGLTAGNYVIVQLQPGGYNSVKDFDATPDGDIVPNTNMNNDTLPLTLTLAETDAENYFIEVAPCSPMVTTTQDGIPGSLRYIIDCSDNGDTIKFHPLLINQVIHLNAGLIEIGKNLFIHSDLIPMIMIQSDMSGAFRINAGTTVEFRNIAFTSGLSGYLGAQFENYGHLILWDVNVIKNALLLPGNYIIYNQGAGQLTIKGSFQLNFD